MSTKQAELEARRYLEKTSGDRASVSDEQYAHALRKATASFDRLQAAVRLAERNKASIK
jgi:hypothetical protein